MTGSLTLYLSLLFAVARLIAPTSAFQPGARSDDDDDLEEWRAAINRTSSTETCPSSCKDDPGDLSSWFLFPDVASLANCNETMLLSFSIQEEVVAGQEEPITGIRGCKADYSLGSAQNNSAMSDDNVAAVCETPNHRIVETTVSVGEPASNTIDGNELALVDDLLLAARQVRNYLSTTVPSCEDNVEAFGYSRTAVVGLFAGVEVYQHNVHANILSRFLKDLEDGEPFAGTRIAQLCPGNGFGADYAVGIIAGPVEDLTLIQGVMRSWVDGRCVSGNLQDYMTASVRIPGRLEQLNSTSSSVSLPAPSSPADSTEEAHIWARARLAARAVCKTTHVHAGDGCDAVAKRCGITTANLKKFNPAKNFCTTLVPEQVVCCSAGTLPDPIPPANPDGTCKFKSVISGDSCGSLASKCGLKPADFTKLHPAAAFCSTLQVGQRVCCTHGKLPDITPKPDPNGNCAVYTIKENDGCSVIAVSHGITQAQLGAFNKNTWGWNGCSQPLFPGQKICLSTGTPPFPPPISNADCGPQVPGTKKPASGSSDTWANLNPCPLNVCCNVWGQCGITDDYCVKNPASTGAPGTTKTGKNSCISHCGRDIVKGSAPSETMRIAYFESWNSNRPCLNMDVTDIDTSKYTHVHFAFANITESFAIDVSGAQAQFNKFKTLTGVKRIVSFGGWDFSTAPGTYNILREATRAANRGKFESNIVAFVKNNNLDGVDIDWEYPGAPDIPGIPAGDPAAGEDLHQTVTGLKTTLGNGKTVSVAAPASYWYLKAFPIKAIGAKIDYIVYLTYDLHGQWDYGNQWTSDGCHSGNCLRSHVNLTETKDALALITKAGVASNKVVVGVASYGRSFKMAQAGCSTPNCKFTGSPRASNAAKGRCTKTAGYISNAEINDIIAHGHVNNRFVEADSNILVYNGTEWVAYMNDTIKASRAKVYASYNFLGTSDWAVDLQEFLDDTGGDDGDDGYDPDFVAKIDDNYYVECDSKYNSLDQLKDRKGNIPSYCMDQYIVDVLVDIMDSALDKYEDLVGGGYDDKFQIYEDYTIEQVPAQINAFMGNGHAGDFFKCEETKYRTCCSSCHYATCLEDCDNSDNCKDGLGTEKTTCPTVYKNGPDGIDWYNTKVPNVTYTLQDSDGFYSAISEDYGIEKDWIKFGDTDVRVSNGCQFSDDIKECQKKQDDWFWNYPEAAGNIKVFNPKDVVGKSYDKFKGLLFNLKLLNAIGDLDSQLSMADLVDAASLPALTIASAVDSMEKVVKRADEIKKEEREQFIADFIGGILFFIPFVGEAVDASLAAVRAALKLAEAAGEAGLLAYSVVQDPKDAFSAVFSTLAGAGLSRGSWGKAADERRSLSEGDAKKLGSVHDDLSTINDVRGGLCAIL
ncbi:glycoside hydrolase family 18 protein [Nemania sp. NC0429]|nr:glycoside hydrolase family 18 protein [Nemania sp. NC0429]